MKAALPALQEANRKDAAELLERAIRARMVMLQGRRDDEAAEIRERAPSRQQLVEVLRLAADWWHEFNNPEKAEAVGRLAVQLSRAGHEEPRAPEPRVREREQRREGEAAQRREVRREQAPAEAQRREEMQLMRNAVRELQEQLEAIRGDLKEIRELLRLIADKI